MKIFLSLMGVIFSLAIIKFREYIGNAIGEAEWMRKVGGVYTVVVVCGVLGFFWSIAFLTGTEDVFFAPVLMLFPKPAPPPAPDVF